MKELEKIRHKIKFPFYINWVEIYNYTEDTTDSCSAYNKVFYTISEDDSQPPDLRYHVIDYWSINNFVELINCINDLVATEHHYVVLNYYVTIEDTTIKDLVLRHFK